MSAFYSIYVQDTVRYFVRMVPGVLAAAVLFLCLRPRRLRRLEEQGLVSPFPREIGVLLFWLFCGGMAMLTLTPGWFHWLSLLRGLIPEHGPFFSLGSWNLVPGRSFSGGMWIVYMLLGNIVMFLPFGFFPALLWRGCTWRRALVTGLCVTGFIECWQLLVGRAFDIDDLLLNTLGALCGFWLWLLLRRAFPRLAEAFQVREKSVA